MTSFSSFLDSLELALLASQQSVFTNGVINWGYWQGVCYSTTLWHSNASLHRRRRTFSSLKLCLLLTEGRGLTATFAFVAHSFCPSAPQRWQTLSFFTCHLVSLHFSSSSFCTTPSLPVPVKCSCCFFCYLWLIIDARHDRPTLSSTDFSSSREEDSWPLSLWPNLTLCLLLFCLFNLTLCPLDKSKCQFSCCIVWLSLLCRYR